MTRMSEAQYPKYSIQQQISNCGQKSFEYHKPDNWISVSHSVDLGFNYKYAHVLRLYYFEATICDPRFPPYLMSKSIDKI